MWKATWEFINSNWGTSIIAGLLTGFLVSMLWEWGKRFRERKHYLESIELGNNKIFDIMESSIPEKQFLSDEVLISLPKSVSKEYKVHIEDLAPLTLIIDCVIKKIIESNFLSNENKVEYSNNLISVRKRIEVLEQETNKKDRATQYINKHLIWLKVKPQTKKISISSMSILMGSIVSIIIIILALLKGDPSPTESENAFATLLIALLFVIMVFTMFYRSVVLRKRKQKGNKKVKEEGSFRDNR